MSWSSAPTTSRSGRSTRSTSADGVGRGLAQMAVDREAMEGVALRLAAHRAPTRAGSARSRSRWSRVSTTSMAGRPACSSRVNSALALVGPRRGQIGGGRGQTIERVSRRSAGRPRRPPPPPAATARGQRSGRRPRSRQTRPSRNTTSGARTWSRAIRQPRGPFNEESDPLPHLVAGPGDRPRRGADRTHELVGIGIAERGRHLVLLLEQQPITRPLRHAVQLDARIEQDGVVGVEGGVVALEHHGLGQLGPPDGVHVTQPAPPFLQVGLEQEGHLAGLGLADADPRADLGQPTTGPLAPQGQRPIGQIGGQRGIAGEVAHGRRARWPCRGRRRRAPAPPWACARSDPASGPRPTSGTRWPRRWPRCP